MSKAYLFYDNKLTSSLLTSVTATTQADGYSVANAYDWRTTSYWSPTASGVQTITTVFSSAVTADYFAIYRHNLGTTGGTVKLQYSVDSGANWLDATTATTLTDNELKISLFDETSSTHWRVYFSLSATGFYCGVLMFGQAFNLYRGMPSGFVVPKHGRKNTIINQKTEGGQFAGRAIVSHGAKTTIVNKFVPANWYRENIEPFILHAERYPFLFSWNHTDRPSDACWCETDGDIPDAPIDENYRQNINIPVNCLLSGVL